MEPITAFLLIIGCSNNLATCRELPAPAPFYASAESCQVDQAITTRAYMGERKYPRIISNCFAIDPSLAEGDATIVWNMEGNGELAAYVQEDPGVAIANDLAGETLISSAE